MRNACFIYSILLHIVLLVVMSVHRSPAAGRPMTTPRPVISATLVRFQMPVRPAKVAVAKKRVAKPVKQNTVLAHHAATKKAVKSERIKAHRQALAQARVRAKVLAKAKAKARAKALRIKARALAKARAKAEAERQLHAQIAEEQKQFMVARRTQLNREIDHYKRQLVTAIGRRWLMPKGVDPTRACRLLIRVAPGGEVLDVQLIKSSGNPALDRSVLAAVHKASPLPVPADPSLFDQFRALRLTVRPEDVI